ncbi:Hypothetical_protein [Hexamita inflata]|uniref:Hypothetical_protein n=1 Tax=Hexamita inflata TaxID=28002 RepID=A0AA86UGE6_9EUKA|nr:Hypothetical protein HINF_LOCUS37772 [Hexamita inflata]
MHITQKSTNMFMFTDYTQNIDVGIEVFNENVNAFALFGFNLKTNIVKDSQVNISLNFEVFHGALVCIICDVEIYNCSLVFVASGKQLSGLVGEAPYSVFLQQSFIQYRLTSINASGIVNQINNANANISIIDCKLTGSNLIESGYNGYIACEIVQPIIIIISSFVVCTDNIQSLGNQSAMFVINGIITQSCDICGVQKVVYGLCGDSILYAVEHNGLLTCDSPFEYMNNQCQCMYGYLRDGSVCVDVIDAIHQSSQTMQNNNKISELQTNISNIELQIQQLNDSMLSNFNQIYSAMYNNSNILEGYIISNITKLQNSTCNSISLLENRIQGNISGLSNQTYNNLTQIENYILGNFSSLQNMLNSNITILNNSIVIFTNEIQQLNYSIQNISLYVNQTIISLNNSIIQIDNQVSNINNTLTTNILNMQQSIEDSNSLIDMQQSQIGVLMIQSLCLNLEQSHYTSNNECVVKYQINCSDDSLSCKQNIYVSVYDVTSVTDQVTSSGNFSSGYVFSNTKVIKNAFIDVSDGVYSTVQPLFQSQNVFNNIKIQIGTQTVSSGSMLTTSSSIVVNLVNIVSKTGSIITVNTASQLNIFLASSSSVNIINLFVNLNFAMSDGNITLIKNIGGVLNISGYQIIGQYQSSKTVTMIGNQISATVSYIQLVSFNPDLYNVGPDSSYLLGYAVDSIFNVDQIAIILGNSTNYQIATSSLSSSYPFGGIITNMGSSTKANIQNVILNSYLKYNTYQLTNCGFLVGQASMAASTIQISKVCFQQVADCTLVTKVYYIGLIGQAYGNVSLQSLSVSLSVQLSVPTVTIQYVGIVGQLNSNCPIVEVINLKASVNVSSTSNRYVGTVFGYQAGNNSTISNASISNSNLSSATFVGGIIGYVKSTNQTIYNTTLFQSNVTGTASYIGGLVGQCDSTKLTVTSSIISSVRISTGGSFLGIIIGGQSGTGNTQMITSSASIGNNYANGVLLANCLSLTNALVQKGC